MSEQTHQHEREGHGQHGHHHHHVHPHPHHQHGSFADANRHFFDESVASGKQFPFELDLARLVGKAALNAYVFDKEKTTLMDYACGGGLVSKELLPYTKSIVGVDISQGMVDRYNRLASEQGMEMKAVRAELKGAPGELNDAKFDVIICSLAYHHFASIDEATRMLSFFLKPGGTLLIVDILRPTSSEATPIPLEFAHIVPHVGGFEEADMRAIYDGAGLIQFQFNPLDNPGFKIEFHPGTEIHLFLAKGIKAVDA